MATPPVFTAGQVLTAAQMNAVGLWLITDNTFSAVTSFSLPNDTFTADFVNYRFLVRITAVAVDNAMSLRMRASGTDASAANYDYAFTGLRSDNTPDSINGQNQTSIAVGSQDNVIIRYSLALDIFTPRLAQPTIVSGVVSSTSSAGILVGRYGVGAHQLANAYDSLTFISTQNVTGEYWVYGYNT
jgi:hypothetical protein